jgi:hypothetical protein
MRNGIYRVEFRSGRRIGLSGLVVLKDGTVNGGDDGFVYRGTYNVEGQKVTAQIGISKHNPGAQSIFGPIENWMGVPEGIGIRVTPVAERSSIV